MDDGRRRATDGRTLEHGYSVSSPCEPDGSDELKKGKGVPLASSRMDNVVFEPH